MSHFDASSAREAHGVNPIDSPFFLSFSWLGAKAKTFSAFTFPVDKNPFAIAWAMLPIPINPMFVIMESVYTYSRAKAIAVLDADGFTDFRPKNYENLAVSLILEHQDWSHCRKQLLS